MSNKFYMLGKYQSLEQDRLKIAVRKNFRDHDGNYTIYPIELSLGVSVSELLLDSLKFEDVVHVQGRIELDQSQKLKLIVEHLLKVSSLS